MNYFFHAECAETYRTQTLRRFAFHIIQRILRVNVCLTQNTQKPTRQKLCVALRFI